MSDTPFKIIVDSRDASEGHGGRFSYSLPQVMQVPAGFCCYINQASVSNSFLSVGTFVGSKSHYFYWFERLTGNATVFNRASLPEQNYDAESLASALQTAVNSASWFGGDLYTIAYNQSKNTLNISIPDDGVRSFFIPDDSLLALPQFQAQTNPRTAGFVEYTPDWSNPQSCLGLLGLGRRSSAGTSFSEFMALLASSRMYITQDTGAIDVRRLHNVYVRSRALSNMNTIGPPDAQSLLCKIPVTNQPGDVLSRYHNGAVHDYIACGGRTLSSIDVFCTDYAGNMVDLRGGTLSLELLFCQMPI